MRDIELRVINLALTDRSQYYQIRNSISDKMFEEEDIRFVWNLIDEHTNTEQLRDLTKGTETESTVSEILASTPTNKAGYYIEQIRFNYSRIILADVSRQINEELFTISIEEIVKRLENEVPLPVKNITMISAVTNSLKVIQDRFQKKTRRMYKTGWKEFDQKIALDTKKLILVPAEKKIGKSRFIVALMYQLIKHNKKFKIQWWTLEMTADEVIRCFVSLITGLDDSTLLCKTRELTPSELKEVEKAHKMIESFPIEFIEESDQIYGIKRSMKRFKSLLKDDEDAIFILDNLGFVKPHSQNPNQQDIDIAVAMKDVRDDTGGNVFVLHHLTKAAGAEKQLEKGYEPNLEHIRGTGRLMDFVNMVWMLHRPNHYKDLINYHKKLMSEEPDKYRKLEQLFLVMVKLNRSGMTDNVRLKHNIGICRFGNFS